MGRMPTAFGRIESDCDGILGQGVYSMRTSFTAFAIVVLFVAPSSGQGDGGGDNDGTDNAAGISINAEGMVNNLQFKPPSPKLGIKQRQALATKHLSSDLNKYSKLRCVSLVRLQERIKELIEGDTKLSPDVAFLAGVQRIDYVFVDTENNDLILAGPGEGFAPTQSGRVIGITTARPPLRLDDLIVALRTVPKTANLGCSIDPVPERLAKTQDWISRNSQAATAQIVAARYQKMAEILGAQNVTVWGLPEDSHLANVFVEADYRMKRVVMGLENPKVRGFRSHLAMLKPGKNSLRRWWFTPLYDEFERSEDQTAWKFSGQRAQLLSQEEYSNAAGERFDSPHKLLSAEKFAQQFTKKFPEMCRNVAVFAELQNAFDVTLLAAILSKYEIAERIGWEMSLLLDEQQLPAEVLTPAKLVPTLANVKRHSGRLVLGVIGGGVMISPRRTFDNLTIKASPDVAAQQTQATNARGKNWWWDAKPIPDKQTKKTAKKKAANNG